jgi:hypothetical protein
MLNRELHSCKICGYYDEDFLPWGLDGEFPLYEICPCCEAESGYEDFTLESIIHNRNKWVESPKFRSNEKYREQLVNYLEYLKQIK